MLRDRLRGPQPQAGIRANNHKLTVPEEETLVKWILISDKRGLPLRPAYIKDMVNHLLSQRSSKASQQKVGVN